MYLVVVQSCFVNGKLPETLLRASTEAEPRGEGFGKVGAQSDLDKRQLSLLTSFPSISEFPAPAW